MKALLLLIIIYFFYKSLSFFNLFSSNKFNDNNKDEYKNLDITDAEFEDMENEN